MTAPRYVGAIDQGTTSTRFLIFDAGGGLAAAAQKEHRQLYPQLGWVEHDPVEIWERSREVLHEALDAAGLSSTDLAAIGIANQRETTVVWERATGWAGRERDRVAGHPYGRTLPRPLL